MSTFLLFVSLAIWAVAWMSGGYLLAAAAFPLRRERLAAGLALGLTLQLWLFNLLAQWLPFVVASWISAMTVLLLGSLAAWRSRFSWGTIRSIPLGQGIALVVLGYVFLAVERGLNLFDDFQNITTVSLMATGDIPPHFPFDPRLRYGYHHLLLLFAAQWTRLWNLPPWMALDLARAWVLTLLLVLVYAWAGHMARSRLAGGLAAMFVAFAGGARWVLLILPEAWVYRFSQSVTLLGSGADSAPDLFTGLTAPWRIEGDGPIPFPFAFANGVNPPATMAHGGVGAYPLLMVVLLIVLFRRLRTPWQGILLVPLVASYALIIEYDFLVMYAALGLVLLLHWFGRRRVSIPRSFWQVALVMAGALPLVLVQGGVLTEMARERLLGGGMRQSFHTFHFSLSAPSVISGHLGRLDLFHPDQFLVALLELGPVLLVTPLLFAWGWKMVRAQRWWEGGVALGGIFILIPLLVKYAGSAGPSANARLFSILLHPATLYAIPLSWTWLRQRGEMARLAVASLAGVAMFGGLVLFGLQLVAARQPLLPTFLTHLDVPIYRQYWNRLPEGAVIFDPVPPRAVTVFGRPSDAMVFWQLKPEWKALRSDPDPYALRAAGYTHMYFDRDYWDSLTPLQQERFLTNSCVRLIDEVQGVRSLKDQRRDFRRLLEITDCSVTFK